MLLWPRSSRQAWRSSGCGRHAVEAEIPRLVELIGIIVSVLYHDCAECVRLSCCAGSTVTFEELTNAASPESRRCYASTRWRTSSGRYPNRHYANVLQNFLRRCKQRTGILRSASFGSRDIPDRARGGSIHCSGGDISHAPDIQVNGRMLADGWHLGATPLRAAGRVPGLVIPAGMTRDGLPVGLELDGP